MICAPDASSVFHLFGLTVQSQIPLPVPPIPTTTVADVDIRYGSIRIQGSHAWGYSLVEGGTLLSVQKVGRFLIRRGAEIVIDPAAGASETNIRLFLLGSAFGALLHQRGLMPLHANAVVIDGRAFAFCGHSGAGKSTTAAWFHDRGYPLLSDDVCVIGFDANGTPLTYPGVPRVRLWREALEASGRSAGDYERSFSDTDKYDVPIPAGNREDDAPLAAVYLLARAENGAQAGDIQRLTGVAAVETLVSNTYRGAYLRTIGGTGPHLAVCARIARTVPVFKAARVWDLARLDAEASRLEAHARSLLTAP